MQIQNQINLLCYACCTNTSSKHECKCYHPKGEKEIAQEGKEWIKESKSGASGKSTLFPAESTNNIKIKIINNRATRDGHIWEGISL